MAQLLKGAPVAEAIDARTAQDVERLSQKGVTPKLAILRVGDKDSDLSYERGVSKRCAKLGVQVEVHALPADVQQDELIACIDALNADDSVHGVLMFRPLPRHLDQKAADAALAPAKDVDGITAGSLAGVFMGTGAGYTPCTAQACMEILAYYGIETAGKRAVVLGRSLVVGRPVACLLMAANATVTVCHTKTADPAAIARQADILICATGRMESVGADYIAPEAVVLDVGISWNADKGKLCGDADFDAIEPLCAAITPVPGGVGAVTNSVLVSHVVKAALATLD